MNLSGVNGPELGLGVKENDKLSSETGLSRKNSVLREKPGFWAKIRQSKQGLNVIFVHQEQNN
jgi:hypothetical protein